MRRLTTPPQTTPHAATSTSARGFPIARARDDHVGERELAHALLRHAVDLFLVLDNAGMIRYASAAARVLGRVPETLRGLPLAELAHTEDVASLATALDTVATPGAMPTIEARLHHGRVGWRHFALTAIDLRDDP